MAAGTVTAVDTIIDRTGVSRCRITWVSAASGSVTGNSVTLPAGTIVTVTFNPDSGGTQPTDLYDVELRCDEHNINVLDDGAGASIGANLSNATASHKVPFVGGGSVTYVRQWLHGGGYSPWITGAGNAKGGTIDIYQSRNVH
jgi:hypothetical protein